MFSERAVLHFHTQIISNNSAPTSQKTLTVFVTKIIRLMLFREIISVYCEKHTDGGAGCAPARYGDDQWHGAD
jgi:hypothetical protein